MAPETTLRDLRIAAKRDVENVDTATMIAPWNLLDWEAGRKVVPSSVVECLAALYLKDIAIVQAAADASREAGAEEEPDG